jgi:hypothetical protein
MSADSAARPVNPDPYPSGIYSVLSYPSVAEPAAPEPSAAEPSGRAPAVPCPPAQPAPDEVLGRIGDVEVTATSLRTPAGEVPRAGATVEIIEDLVVRTPTWAVLCAIVGFLVVPVLSLLFLLARETVPAGPVRVVVNGGAVRHETSVADPAEVDLARSLARG